MTTRKLIFAIAACLLLGRSQSAVSQVIFSNDFEDDPLGQYTEANLESDWNDPTWSNGVEEGRVAIVDDGDGGKAIRVAYPAGKHGSADDETGAQWRLKFDQGYEAVEASYRVKFGPKFDFVRGGKLPGLFGGKGNTGGNKPNGTDGFSARLHWRTNGSAKSPLRDSDQANLTQYLYHPDQPTKFGDDIRYDDGPTGQWAVLDSDRWYQIRCRIVLNAPGEHNGILQGWIDGVQMLEMDNIRFRDVAELQIDGFFFSTFFGGSGKQWNTTKDETAFFDDFLITEVTEIAGPEQVAEGREPSGPTPTTTEPKR